MSARRLPNVFRVLVPAVLLMALVAFPGGGSRLRAQADPTPPLDPAVFQALRFRSVGPHRGGRVTAVAGHRAQPTT
ncbi:MAG TPA: hypothetical protein VK911_08905, partial [Vicinamibacterales bacterium]|nr:hypothetical protein [Vicinamibacterales bacterium]